MFTLQAKLIENAVRDGDATGMVRAIGNCAAPLLHRGPMGVTHVPASPPHQDTPPDNGDIIFADGPTIYIPPWENIPFYPIPPIDAPDFFPYDYPPPWGDGDPNPFPGTEISVTVYGPTYLGDLITKNITTVDQTFLGDIIYQGERLSFSRADIVSNVYWDSTANALKVTKRNALIVANLGRNVTASVIEGVECAPGIAPNDILDAP